MSGSEEKRMPLGNVVLLLLEKATKTEQRHLMNDGRQEADFDAEVRRPVFAASEHILT